MIFLEQAYFECVIPEKNRKAFYYVVAGRDLFSYVLIRKWGRIGSRGHPGMKKRYLSKSDMFGDYNRVVKKRLKHEYRQRDAKLFA
ncbi:hypothetical protein GF1_16720 [Desulfolithobacter dissulfuricans]|uniref:WGR domain-containing protein n=1 Tax=Desulfolithobacter dissulfuricans TaxID=2795293 RepID=A0A915XL76_9BACT|nr:WGR domain-containing protein [Desulfolithobacter dissulfuricans]BCO09296.1 hypothetical protein GF1_16720 [Desulfolithobacter dissulfuricans]